MVLLWLGFRYFFVFFFFNDTATTEIYTLSLHDALPIPRTQARADPPRSGQPQVAPARWTAAHRGYLRGHHSRYRRLRRGAVAAGHHGGHGQRGFRGREPGR